MTYIRRLAALEHIHELVALCDACQDTHLGDADFEDAVDAEVMDLALLAADDRQVIVGDVTFDELHNDLRRATVRIARLQVEHAAGGLSSEDRDSQVDGQLELVADYARDFLKGNLLPETFAKLRAERLAKFVGHGTFEVGTALDTRKWVAA